MKRLGLIGVITALILALPAFAQQQQQQVGQLDVEDFRQPLEQLREAANDIIDQLLEHHEMNGEMDNGEMSVERDQLEELRELLNEIIDDILGNGMAAQQQDGQEGLRDSLERLQEVLNDIFDAVLQDLDGQGAMGN